MEIERTTQAAIRFLMLVRDNASLLPEAPADWTYETGAARAEDEAHPCFWCGQLADHAVVMRTNDPADGNHWLDLCHECSDATRDALDALGPEHATYAIVEPDDDHTDWPR
jgi:hypothetical protein